jgi:KDO2-lipid IV(A) lauroyltransferase
MLFLRLISYLPFSVLYRISDFLFFVSYRLIKYRRAIVWSNLRNSFPEKSEFELKKIERDFYSCLCDYGVETLKLLTITKTELTKRMHWQNPEILIPYLEKKQSVILLASHQFNWEWLLVSGSINLPMPLDFVYQRQSSNLFDKFADATRTRFGAFGIERQQTARESVKRRAITRAVANVADQFPTFEKRYWTKFLSQETAFFQGISQLPALTQYPVFFAPIKKVQRGHYQAQLIPLTAPPYAKGDNQVIEDYVQHVQQLIREQPENWLWSHARWKQKRQPNE